jgi:hypothetical protein
MSWLRKDGCKGWVDDASSEQLYARRVPQSLEPANGSKMPVCAGNRPKVCLGLWLGALWPHASSSPLALPVTSTHSFLSLFSSISLPASHTRPAHRTPPPSRAHNRIPRPPSNRTSPFHPRSHSQSTEKKRLPIVSSLPLYPHIPTTTISSPFAPTPPLRIITPAPVPAHPFKPPSHPSGACRCFILANTPSTLLAAYNNRPTAIRNPVVDIAAARIRIHYSIRHSHSQRVSQAGSRRSHEKIQIGRIYSTFVHRQNE